MAIQPLDLQVLFSRLGQVGKDQAAARDMPLQAQAVQAQELAKKAHDADQTVQRTEEQETAANLVQERQKRRQHGQGQDDAGQNEEKEEQPLEVVKDPALGNKIDISG